MIFFQKEAESNRQGVGNPEPYLFSLPLSRSDRLPRRRGQQAASSGRQRNLMMHAKCPLPAYYSQERVRAVCQVWLMQTIDHVRPRVRLFEYTDVGHVWLIWSLGVLRGLSLWRCLSKERDIDNTFQALIF